LGDTLTTAFNPFGGSLEAGSGVCTIEVALIKWIADRFGFPTFSSGGHFVSGASMANLTALTVARDQLLDFEDQTNGDDRPSNGVAYLSSHAHFCIRKALRIIGLSNRQIRVINSDANFRMDIGHLQRSISDDLAQGRHPFLIIATCGTTNTGSIDPLEEIAQIARSRGMWMHVDAAYGGSVAFSKSHRAKIKGIGLADSIAWDAHKWLFQTHGCGAVLFREKSHPLKSFASSAQYVRDVEHMATEEDQNTMLDPWNYGMELTRPARHMKLWFTLQVLGTDAIDRMISSGFHLAKHLETSLRQLDGWEITSPGSLAILTFRYAPQTRDHITKAETMPGTFDLLNELISKELTARNVAVIFTTRVLDRVCLRMCMINPNQTTADVDIVVNTLDVVSRECHEALCKD
jgi:glutamate/tyrosine decarboxylase-like PLP-dependent enzyme